jgi:EpsI family protein
MSKTLITVCVLVVLAGVFGNYLRFIEQEPQRPPQFDIIPLEADGYAGAEHRFSEQSYEILKADSSTLRLYESSGSDPVWLFVAYFRSQKYGSQIHSPKHCLPGGGWQILLHEPYELETPRGNKAINRLVIADRGQMQLMLYWFETRGGSLRDEFALKWDLVVNSLMLRPTDAAFVRITVPITGTGGIAGATRQAEEFLQLFQDDIDRALPFGG